MLPPSPSSVILWALVPAPCRQRSPTVNLPLSRPLANLPAEVIREIEELGEQNVYAPGDPIVRRDEEGNSLFLLLSGTAFATVLGADGVWFDDPMSAGAIFGEMALLTGQARSADVTAKTEVICLRVPFEPLRALFAAHPDVAGFLTNIVGRRLTRRSGIRTIDRYEVDEPLGGGGFATVYAGTDRVTGQKVAIKMLRHELVWLGDYADRFRQEAESIRRLVHPNVVRLHGLVRAYATLFIVMDLVDGADLHERLLASGPLSAPECRFVFRAIALALQEAHDKGIIHRDVKPSNILATRDGTVKLVDFGIALTQGEREQRTDRLGAFTGTPHYAAPEHVLGLEMDGRTDLFMLGLTTLELFTGKTPRGEKSGVSEMMKNVRVDLPDPRDTPGMPADLGELLLHCTRRHPSKRFPSCAAAVEYLDARGGDLEPPVFTERAKVDDASRLERGLAPIVGADELPDD